MNSDTENSNKYVNINQPYRRTLKEFLGVNNRVFEVPLFQRYYNWDVSNCRDLYDDIINGFSNKQVHFIGMFMHYSSKSETDEALNFLIDGQQRLTTIILLLSAIRNNVDDEKLIDYINNSFIYNIYDKAPLKIKLKQNSFEFNSFAGIIDHNFDNVDPKSNIYKNYNKFVEWINDDRMKINFADLVDYIGSLECVEIPLKCETNNDIKRIQLIFEKINSTGQNLTSADLIRNYILFTGKPEEQETLHNAWTCIERLVCNNKESSRNVDLITNFVSAFTIRNLYKYIKKDDVYREFKNYCKNLDNIKVLNDMLKYAKYYAIIKYTAYYSYDEKTYELKTIDNGDSYINNTLRMLNALGTDDWIPLFMVFLDKYQIDKNRQKLSDVLELILEYMLRFRIVKASAGGGANQTKIYDIIESIDNGSCSYTLKAIYNKLSSHDDDTTSKYPSDSLFMDNLKTDMNPEHGRVLLYQFNRRCKNEVFDFDKDNVTLEHLMPQTISPTDEDGKWWINHLGKSKWESLRKDYTDCIGNYALLTVKLNASASNSKWPDKRKKIKEHAFDPLARSAAESTNWNEPVIKDRNDRLANTIRQYITGPKGEAKSDSKWLIK